jgi:two-component system NarL family response regulator
VLVADDHGVVLEGLAAIIRRQPDMVVVGQADDGEKAVALWKKLRPDVTLLDLRMPNLDGVGAMGLIRNEDPSARVVVLTTFDTDEEIFRAIKGGARAYLLKDAARDELLHCIRRVHTGETWVEPRIAAKLAGRIGTDPLTARETDALELLAKGSSNREIATALNVSETTVKSHLKNIFLKLNVSSRTEAIAEAVQRGLVRL